MPHAYLLSLLFVLPLPAGKSTLLNTVTGAGVLAEDKLFATLDPTTRRVRLRAGGDVLMSDTVGFIQVMRR